MAGKDLYRNLGKKIDGLTARTPWNDTLHAILKELYTSEEAALVISMPYGLSTLARIRECTGRETGDLLRLLEDLCEKGLILDIWAKGEYHYTISPLIIGIFEFTMMRTRGELRHKEWARLFHEYLQDGSAYFKANLGSGQTVSPLRTLPHEEAIGDYEKASAIVEQADTFAIGVCSCRHEKLHVGKKTCDIPLEKCSSFGRPAETLIRHGLAREVSREEMRDNLSHSRENGLVLCADNVRRDISFICHCCSCCCNVMLGVRQFGYPNMVVSSNFLPHVDREECLQCGVCTGVCPVDAIAPKNGDGTTVVDDIPVVDEAVCLGCGVCAMACNSGSLTLMPREKRMFTPEDSFERVILQSVEQGTLQNLLFSNPNSGSQGVLRAFVGGFLKLTPVKRALTSDTLRSRFLTFIK